MSDDLPPSPLEQLNTLAAVESMLRDDLNTGVLHPVAGAPVIEHAAHAVFPVRSPRIGLIDEVLSLFDPMGPAAD